MKEMLQVMNNQVVVSSRKVAESFGKQHNHVLRDIEEIMRIQNWVLIPMFFSTHYKVEGNRKSYPEYLMNRDGFSLLAMGFTGKEAMKWKLAFLEAFNRMEAELKNRKVTPILPTDYLSALKALVSTEEAKQLAEAQVKDLAPKGEFYDQLMDAKGDVDMNSVAKVLNVGSIKLFAFLRNDGILMKGTNKPLQQFMNKGLFNVIVKTYDIPFTHEVKVTYKTLVTPKGIDFIKKRLKKAGSI